MTIIDRQFCPGPVDHELVSGFMLDMHGQTVLINETGTNDFCEPVVRIHSKIHLIWVGKFMYRKQLGLALRVFSYLKDPSLVLDIVGSGSSQEEAFYHALAVSLAGKARVNSISPGWIDTTGSDITGPDALQQPVGRVGKPEDIAEMILFLSSEKAGFITGENICIDGGMTRQMIYHGEHGWEYRG